MTYRNNLRQFFFPFTQARLAPFIGVSLTFVLVAHKSIEHLASFAYVLAIFAMISAPLSLPLSAVGNIVARQLRDKGNLPTLFRQGMSFTLVLVAISIALAVAAVLILPSLAGSQTLDADVLLRLALIYVPAMPLLILNSYLHFYHESSGQARAYSRIKLVCVALACVYVGAAFVFVEPDEFSNVAISCFLSVEVLQLVCFYWLSKRVGLSFAITATGGIARQILRLGVPASLGLCSQKIFYYLLNERLASIDGRLVADLSIYMCILGIFAIPIAAFSQLHSVHVSRTLRPPISEYRSGVIWSVALTAALMLLLAMTGKLLFFIFGGDTSLFNFRAFVTMSLYLVSGALAAIAVSQLRAMNDAFIPQIAVNALMFALMMPVLYLFDMRDTDIDSFLRYQSLAMLFGFVFLQTRMWVLAKAGQALHHTPH